MTWESDRPTDGFVSCPMHGDLWWQPGAFRESILSSSALEPLHDGLPRPVPGDAMLCPFCGEPLRIELRPTVVKLRG